MTHPPSLLSIIAYARSGALDYACRLFLEGGFELVDDDPAVLSVRGRLLKDRALAAEGAERRRLYLEAAGAYARAGEIGGATYPLINAATLSLLAGRREQSKALARKLLERALAGGDELETPYYRAATHAEALLLLGEIAKARTALNKAFALAPKAYEDHASTLRQFGLILTELGKDTAWLDPLRPPRTLHFAGHMGVGIGAKALKRRLRAVIAKERVGFGYGALAAGADILVAEALLEEGAELHLVLPMPKERFRALSVAGFGDGWTIKFDRILARAASVRAIAGAPDPLFP
ncbi:MAG TPA: TRAFs-binding domain-containing protein, partial [Rhizomicrobium sp.]